MAKSAERLTVVETRVELLLEYMREVRDALLGEKGVTHRVTRVEGQVETLSPRVDKVEHKVDSLTQRVVSLSSLATVVMFVLAEVFKGTFF